MFDEKSVPDATATKPECLLGCMGGTPTYNGQLFDHAMPTGKTHNKLPLAPKKGTKQEEEKKNEKAQKRGKKERQTERRKEGRKGRDTQPSGEEEEEVLGLAVVVTAARAVLPVLLLLLGAVP